MNIMLGNLTVEQMQERLGVAFPQELVTLLNGTHQAEAKDIKPGKWHCFDLPFMLMCGDIGTARNFVEHLGPLVCGFKEPLQIGYK